MLMLCLPLLCLLLATYLPGQAGAAAKKKGSKSPLPKPKRSPPPRRLLPPRPSLLSPSPPTPDVTKPLSNIGATITGPTATAISTGNTGNAGSGGGTSGVIIVGGITSIDRASQPSNYAASMAVLKLNGGDQPELLAGLGARRGELALMEIKSATSQVVAGYAYVVEIVVNVPLSDGTDVLATLRMKLWNRPWMELSESEEARSVAWLVMDAKLLSPAAP